MRQQLRGAVKWVFYWSLSGGDWVESRLTSGNILKLLLAVAGGKFPIFVVMIPQESGTGAGGSLSKNWPKRPRHANKTSHLRQMRLFIFWICDHSEWMKCKSEIWWRGLAEVSLCGQVLKTWTSATILSRVHISICRINWLLNT